MNPSNSRWFNSFLWVFNQASYLTSCHQKVVLVYYKTPSHFFLPYYWLHPSRIPKSDCSLAPPIFRKSNICICNDCLSMFGSVHFEYRTVDTGWKCLLLLDNLQKSMTMSKEEAHKKNKTLIMSSRKTQMSSFLMQMAWAEYKKNQNNPAIEHKHDNTKHKFGGHNTWFSLFNTIWDIQCIWHNWLTCQSSKWSCPLMHKNTNTCALILH